MTAEEAKAVNLLAMEILAVPGRPIVVPAGTTVTRPDREAVDAALRLLLGAAFVALDGRGLDATAVATMKPRNR